jgi:hypothetical protein
MVHVMDPKMNIVNQLINYGWYTKGIVWMCFRLSGSCMYAWLRVQVGAGYPRHLLPKPT